MDNYIQVLKKYAVFSGRASRKEYWMFFLFNILIAIGLGIVFGILGAITHLHLHWLGSLYGLATMLPGIGVSIRRMHDINKSGWWLLISLVPFIGSIILIVMMCQPSVDEGNNFGVSVPEPSPIS